ncbi:piggyBac transposable element-derived protein 3-like [Rhagoletis pomonella]|uniref:piggyBac transposable element-derived protein 3-like n=1 Tax=Rhagoletis pomonella TaxID=28610 RepID=UPI00177B3605|nr:piggyBac transposable element-derived protein 3-like [Rhagoletis pomonella]
MTGHMKVLMKFTNDPIMHMRDSVAPIIVISRNFKVSIADRASWSTGNPYTKPGAEVWYTDGSKLEDGKTGTGIFGPNCKRSIPMGSYPTIFQAEIHAIDICGRECLRRGTSSKNICIMSDSQAALLALRSHIITSKLVNDCLNTLNGLESKNTVLLGWVPGHEGHDGNEQADRLAKHGATTLFHGPEPFCGLTKAHLREVINKLSLNEIISQLEEDDDVLSADIYITPPENNDKSDEDSGDEESANINNLSRRQLLAEAEFRATVSSHNELGTVEDLLNDSVVDETNETPRTSATLAPPLKKRCLTKRKWTHTDIPEKLEKVSEPPNFLEDLDNPLQFFELFFDTEVFELIRSETEKNAIQKGNHNFRVTTEEIKRFIGILLLSGYNHVARYRMYWEQSVDCNFHGVASAMSRNRFEELLRYFHVSDNNNLDKEDKFSKVRPLWDLCNERWVKYFPGDKNLSIDESMIPYYGKHGAKQHIQGKPIRFGYKNWSICTRLGYLIYGELYQGAKTGNTRPELGVGASVVLDLISKLPPGSYSFYMDNYFTSLPLLDEIIKLGHDATGTIRANRVEKAPLKDPKTMKRTIRGSYNQCTDTLSNITLVRYNDNNIVTVASTQSGVEPIGKVKRYCEKQKKDIDQPRCIINYNKYMGGVDRLDQNVGCYRISIRLKRWYWQLLMFPINVCVNNAYQLYSNLTLDYEKFVAKIFPGGHQTSSN